MAGARLSYSPPPSSVQNAVTRFSPGLWQWWNRALTDVYRRVPFSVTSWWRSPSYNREVGGAEESQHLLGIAVDAQASDLARLEAAFRAQGMRTIRYSRHVHAQTWPAGVARPILRYLGW